MTETEKGTAVYVNNETAAIIRLLSDRTGIAQVDLLNEIFKSVRVQLRHLNPNRRLIFMADADLKNKMTHIRLSDSFLGLVQPCDLPEEIRKELDAQTQKENRELRGER